jgi:hypothetical protein
MLMAVSTAALATILGLWLASRAAPPPAIASYAQCAEAGYPVTASYPASCSDGHHTWVGPGTAPASPPLAATAQPFDILVTGDSGGTYPQRQETITTAADWQHYWRTVHAGLASTPPLLPVDFTVNQVLALSEGRQATDGYNLKITAVTTSPAGTIVDVTESIPTVTCQVKSTPTNRYFIARTTKLPPPVTFRITTDRRHC